MPPESNNSLRKAHLHLRTVNETWFQHARMSFGFARQLAGFTIRCLGHTLTRTNIAGSPVSHDMKALAHTMAQRNPAALAEAMTMDVVLENQIWRHMACAAFCATLHAALPGWHCNSASVHLIRAVRGFDTNYFKTR